MERPEPKPILYIYRLIDQNLMETANQKSTIDTHIKIEVNLIQC